MIYTKTGKEHCRYRHGMCGTRPYKIWGGMLTRCHNENDPNYKGYGAKGINVCKEWRKDFTNFWNDMQESYADDLQIDRIDNSKGYSKENCRWVTTLEQNMNRDYLKLYPYKEEMLPVSTISRLVGIRRGTFEHRLKRGWSWEKTLHTPLKKYAGVSWDRSRSKWQVAIKRNGKMNFVGRYKTKREALKARVDWLKANH